jgi:hypothetical protein
MTEAGSSTLNSPFSSVSPSMETRPAFVFLLRPRPHSTATAAPDIISLVSEKFISSKLHASQTTLPFNTTDIGFSGVP